MDRVLELAIVHVDAQGRVVDEWATRFNPEGPVGATHIHGIRDADVAASPFFRDLAPAVASRLQGLPVAAHNASFDLAFLRAEFETAGWDTPSIPSFCTLHASHHYMPDLTRRRLADCCWAAGVTLENAHSALGDARATAGLMNRYIAGHGGAEVHADLLTLPAHARTVLWPAGPSRQPTPRQRAVTRPINSRPIRFTPARPKQPPLIKQLTALSLLEVVDEGAPEGTMAYLEILLDCLEDGELSDTEAAQLADLIAAYGLSDADVAATHRACLLALAHRALDDGHVSHEERAELYSLAELLAVPRSTVLDAIKHADAARAARMSAGLLPLPDDWTHGEPLRVGDKVGFTGCDEAQREQLEKRAEELGVRVTGCISRLTAMLVTDGTFAGTKLAKATEVGTRVVHPDVFEVLLTHLQPTSVQQANTQAASLPQAMSETPSGVPSATANANAVFTVPPAQVRAWAAANGYSIGVRGRLPLEVVEAFTAATA
jgi:DNA polymerase-3 subunit epsilon